jgi:hypothetical protein
MLPMKCEIVGERGHTVGGINLKPQEYTLHSLSNITFALLRIGVKTKKNDKPPECLKKVSRGFDRNVDE